MKRVIIFRSEAEKIIKQNGFDPAKCANWPDEQVIELAQKFINGYEREEGEFPMTTKQAIKYYEDHNKAGGNGWAMLLDAFNKAYQRGDMEEWKNIGKAMQKIKAMNKSA